MRKIWPGFLIAILVFHFCNAQNTQSFEEEELVYERAHDLFNKGKYNSARSAFDRLYQISSGERLIEAKYYSALSGLYLYHPDAINDLRNFQNDYSDHPLSKGINFELGKYYYQKGDFPEAANYFRKVDYSGLDKEQVIESQFKMAYSLFTKQDFDDAKPLFNNVKGGAHKYSNVAYYYSGIIAYKNSEYSKAEQDFKKASTDDSYKVLTPELFANIYYKQKRFDELEAIGQEVISNKAVRNKANIYLILADSYYERKNYSKAKEYFDEYMKGRRSAPAPDIAYRIGFCDFQLKDYNESISMFNEAALRGNDSIIQMASYYLGQVHLNNDNINYAETAFETASRSDINPKVKEESFFALAKLKFDSKLRAQSIDLFQEYISNYKNGKYLEDANQYLSEAFLTSNNYDAAISHIEKIENKSRIILETYQKVTFFKGVESFNNSEFGSAIENFDKSLKNDFNKEFKVMASYWKGEALSIKQRYPDAINSYSVVFRNEENNNSEIFLKTRYGIAYAYFNTKQYDKALTHFKAYSDALKNKEDKMYYEDAVLRMADCYLVLKDNDKAFENYLLASKIYSKYRDYSYFRLGVVSWFRGNKNIAQEYLSKVLKDYENSIFYDDALYEYANIEFENSSFENAIKGFTRLIDKEEKSPFLPYAYLNRGISYTNINKPEKAVVDYRVILDKYTSHRTAADALTGLQEALHLSGRDDEFDADKRKFAAANPESEALVSLDFEGARNQYFSGNYKKAIEKFKAYLKEYSRNSYYEDANYYLAESYYLENKGDSALKYHLEVLKNPGSSFLNKSILRTGDIQYDNENYREAISKFNLLRHLARSRNEEIFAWQGLMLSYYNLSEYDTAISFGQLIAEKGEAAFGARNKALLYMGKSAENLKQYDKAEEYYEDCIEAGKDANAAEAKFRIAKIKSDLGDYETSNKIGLDLIGDFSHYPKWNDEAFLLIAENFYKMGEIFQSKSTLESIIANSPSEETVSRAKSLLNTIIQEDIQKEIENSKSDSIE